MMRIVDDGIIRYRYAKIDLIMSSKMKMNLLAEIFAEYNPKIERLLKIRTAFSRRK